MDHVLKAGHGISLSTGMLILHELKKSPCNPQIMSVRVCRYSFFVAGLAQTWHWGFHSCNGLSADGDHEKWGGPYEVLAVSQAHSPTYQLPLKHAP